MKKRFLAQYEVWAQLNVSSKSCNEIFRFFRNEYNIDPEFLISPLHLTVYHSRRPMPKLKELQQACSLSIDTLDTRFMVLAPGGENPQPKLNPAKKKVGIRIKRDSVFRKQILAFRKSILIHETPKVLGSRKPSTAARNAFGARNFQPHISFLLAGSGMQWDLTEVGEKFRDCVPEIFFDKFVIKNRKNF